MISALVREQKELISKVGPTVQNLVSSNLPVINTEKSAANTSVVMDKKIYIGKAAQILKYMGAGCNEKEAAEAIGIDPSYVSQLCTEKDFSDQVTELRGKEVEQGLEIDKNYNQLEFIVAEKLLKAVSMVTDTDKLIRVAKFANEAKRKVAPQTKGGDEATATVTLILPDIVRREFVVNPNNEIVGIDNRQFTTIPTNVLEEKMRIRQQDLQRMSQKKEEAEDIVETPIKELKGSRSDYESISAEDDL